MQEQIIIDTKQLLSGTYILQIARMPTNRWYFKT